MNLAHLIQNKPWRASWPSQITETLEGGDLPDVPWKGQMVRYRRLFNSLEGQGHCSFKEMQEFIERMQDWSDRHAVYFTFPATMDGFRRAVWATLSEPQGKDDMAWLWAGYGPSVRLALSEKPSDPHWANVFQKAIEASLKPAPTTVAASAPETPPAPPVSAPVASPAVPAKDFSTKLDQRNAEKVEPESVVNLREWLTAALMASFADKPEGVLQEEFDHVLKVHAAEKAINPRVLGTWIEYELFPAAAGLDEKLLKRMVAIWPESHTGSFVDPARTLSQKRFWAILEDVKQPAREVVFTEVLPKLINSEQWDSPLRYELAKHMLAWTTRRPEAFEERLQLWFRWGGRLNDAPEVVVSENQGRFAGGITPVETVEDWVRSQKNEELNKIIDKYIQKPLTRKMRA